MKALIKVVGFLCVVLIIAVNVSAQSVMNGKVTDTHGVPLVGASVNIAGRNAGTTEPLAPDRPWDRHPLARHRRGHLGGGAAGAAGLTPLTGVMGYGYDLCPTSCPSPTPGVRPPASRSTPLAE